jgi:hypothetical protein
MQGRWRSGVKIYLPPPIIAVEGSQLNNIIEIFHVDTVISVLIQLRTGRIGLNQYLTRINVRQDARCGCGLGNQNPGLTQEQSNDNQDTELGEDKM